MRYSNNTISSTNKKLTILIDFVLGFKVGVGVVLLFKYLDNTFKLREELEKILDLPIIGAIPDYNNLDEYEEKRILILESNQQSVIVENY